MKIALIQCPAWGPILPLGIASLKSYLVKNGYDVKCFDLNISFYNSSSEQDKEHLWGSHCYNQWSYDYSNNKEIRFSQGSVFNDTPLPLRQWADEILSFDPYVVGFSTNLTNKATSLLLARELKTIKPELFITFGGPSAAENSHGYLILRSGIPDVVVHGEGEETLLEIIRVLEKGGDLYSIPGIGYFKYGSTVWTSARPPIRDFDSLPFPDFSDFTLNQYLHPNDIPIMASRGCTRNCVYCYETVFWEKFRSRSAKNIFEEMTYRVAQYAYRLPANGNADADHMQPTPLNFIFADSLINGNLKVLRELCDILIEQKLIAFWGGQANIDKRMDDEFFLKMKQAGCVWLAFGLESGSQKVLDDMGKKFLIRDAGTVIESAYKAGIWVTVNVMVGFPTESFLDFIRTVVFLFKIRKWIVQVSNVTTTQINFGTPLWSNAKEYNVTLLKDGSWTSPETGNVKNRNRRQKLLHWAMDRFNIPHQKIAED